MVGMLAALAALAIRPDTVLVLGSRSIDMTGDGLAETLVLVGTGPSLDSLEITFQINSLEGVLYAASLSPITRREARDGRPRLRTPAQQAAFVARFAEDFFAEGKFVPASRFLSELRRQAPGRVAEIPSVIARHRAAYENHAIGRLERAPASTDTTGTGRVWQEMLARDRLVFRFSPGGDATTGIAWSDRDRRFYRLLECC